MKNNILTKTFCFLENHIALILGLFFPAWFIFLFLSYFSLAAILPLLPKEMSDGLTLRLIHVPFVILGSLVIIAIIAILRMVRDVRDRKPKQIFLYMFLIALDLIFMSLFFVWFGAVQLKQDNAYITSNLSLISKDFIKTYYFDIHSAEYHAPAEDSNDPEYKLVTLRAKDHLRFVRRDGSVGCEYLKNTH